jgi:quercetin dioxygenase-like cupin family protein
MEISRGIDRAAGTGPEEWFTGPVWLDRFAAPPAPARVQAAAVTFAPRSRTAWHTHPLGQTLYVLHGTALIGRDDGSVERLRPGDAVSFAPGERHWHGASPEGHMTHVAIQETDEHGNAADWAEHVTDEQYGA